MAPGIAGSFTADVQGGNPPFDVQFTDTTVITDGFARYWFWEFGDGTISTEQNPVHTYTGEPGTKYDVRLSIIATTDEFQSLTIQDKAAIFISATAIKGISNVSASDAWDNRGEESAGTSIIARHRLRYSSPAWEYATRSASVRYETGFDDALHLLVLHVASVNNYIGIFNSSPGGSLAPGINTPTPEDRMEVGRLSLSSASPITASIDVTPIEEINGVPNGQTWGLNVQPFTRTYYSHGTQSWNDHEELSFITINSPPIAAFTASPTAGSNPLIVNFTNLSTPAIGTPTTYSWKKRISGSGNPFGQFSTEIHPAGIIFSK